MVSMTRFGSADECFYKPFRETLSKILQQIQADAADQLQSRTKTLFWFTKTVSYQIFPNRSCRRFRKG